MAQDMPAFDELEEVSAAETDEDATLLDLEPGESVVGKLAHIERDTGEDNNDMVHLIVDGEPKKKWSNATMDKAFSKADVQPGDVIGLRKSEEQEEFTRDGEEVAYYPYDVRVEPQDGGSQ